MEAADFFETQTSKNCSVHSLNNAVGRKIIEPNEVVAAINKRVAKEYLVCGTECATKLRHLLSHKDTFFAADAVWEAAISLGRIQKPLSVPGFGGDYAIVMPWMVNKGVSLIFLGVRKDRSYHATAARDGKFYDSLASPPKAVPLTTQVLADQYDQVFAAFRVRESNADAARGTSRGLRYLS
jgi:hypothetical protein